MAAYRNSKSDPERNKRIQAATLRAAEIPLEVARDCLRVAELALIAADIGNKNAITDAGAGVNLAQSALTSAGYNVRINLRYLDETKQTKTILSEIEELEKSGTDLINKIQGIMTKRGKIY